MKPNQKDIDIAEWVELDSMKREIRNVFASLSKTDELSADDIDAIHNILFKKKKNKSNIVRPLPPAEEGAGARVGYYRSEPNLLAYSIPDNENILY